MLFLAFPCFSMLSHAFRCSSMLPARTHLEMRALELCQPGGDGDRSGVTCMGPRAWKRGQAQGVHVEKLRNLQPGLLYSCRNLSLPSFSRHCCHLHFSLSPLDSLPRGSVTALLPRLPVLPAPHLTPTQGKNPFQSQRGESRRAWLWGG